MADTFVMKTGDTLPPLEATLIDGTGTVVNLTDTAVELHVATRFPRVVVLSAPGEIVNALLGQVQLDWSQLATEDLLATGVYYAEWQVTFSDATVVTFPNHAYFIIQIVPELG